MLREPVDLEVGMQLPQLVDDRKVPLRMPETDRRGQVERTLAPAWRRHPAAAYDGRRDPVDELADHQVDPDRVPCGRAVADAFEQHEGAAGQLGELLALLPRTDPVALAVHHH